MGSARIARPGAIYDASAAAQTFSVGKTIDILGEKEDFSENEENEDPQKERENDFEQIPGFSKILQGRQTDVDELDLLKGNKKSGQSQKHLRWGVWYFRKGDSEIKRGYLPHKNPECWSVRKRNRDRNTHRCGGGGNTDQIG